MILQKLINISGLSIGFASAISFCIGVILQTAKQMSVISGNYYSGNNALAEALAAQQAQYSAGALLLFVSFGFQLWATGIDPSIQASLPQFLENEYWLALVILLSSLILAWPVARLLFNLTIQRVKSIRQSKVI